MARGKYKKKRKAAQKEQVITVTSEQLYELPGNTIPDYCFTEKAVCDRIDAVTHKCNTWDDPVKKCRPGNPNFGCVFSPTLAIEKVDKRFTVTGRRSKRRRVGVKVASRTPGRQKGVNCQASPIQRYCAKYSRAYKHPEYASIVASMGKK